MGHDPCSTSCPRIPGQHRHPFPEPSPQPCGLVGLLLRCRAAGHDWSSSSAAKCRNPASRTGSAHPVPPRDVSPVTAHGLPRSIGSTGASPPRSRTKPGWGAPRSYPLAALGAAPRRMHCANIILPLENSRSGRPHAAALAAVSISTSGNKALPNKAKVVCVLQGGGYPALAKGPKVLLHPQSCEPLLYPAWGVSLERASLSNISGT